MVSDLQVYGAVTPCEVKRNCEHWGPVKIKSYISSVTLDSFVLSDLCKSSESFAVLRLQCATPSHVLTLSHPTIHIKPQGNGWAW